MADEALHELGEMIAAAQADAVVEKRVAVGELTLIATVAGLRRLVTHLRDNAACAFTTWGGGTARPRPASARRR